MITYEIIGVGKRFFAVSSSPPRRLDIFLRVTADLSFLTYLRPCQLESKRMLDRVSLSTCCPCNRVRSSRVTGKCEKISLVGSRIIDSDICADAIVTRSNYPQVAESRDRLAASKVTDDPIGLTRFGHLNVVGISRRTISCVSVRTVGCWRFTPTLRTLLRATVPRRRALPNID